MSLGAEILATWKAERARHSAEAGSDSVVCSGSASAIYDLTNFATGIIAVCAAHLAWLQYHCWDDGGMNTGPIIVRDGGPWERRGCDEIERWRDAIAGWRQIDASDRAAVAEVSAHLPDGVAHSRRWVELVAQAEARPLAHLRVKDGR